MSRTIDSLFQTGFILSLKTLSYCFLLFFSLFFFPSQCYCEDSEGTKMDADEHAGRQKFGKLIEREKGNIEKLYREGV